MKSFDQPYVSFPADQVAFCIANENIVPFPNMIERSRAAVGPEALIDLSAVNVLLPLSSIAVSSL
jgi:hypothetical protein